MDSTSQQCLGSEVSGCHPGIPREQMTAPEERAYLAELDALPSMAVPDEPAVLCWDCRRLAAAGRGPQAEAIRQRAGLR
jgi:hypothetical protein